MAVIQVSLIQVRSGLNENLPTLATGEFGWSVDTQQLYIGNGTAAEGSPLPGQVTEILTQYSAGNFNYSISALEANVANLQANVTTLQSEIGDFSVILADAQASIANTTVQLASLKTNTIDYNIVRGTAVRVGSIKVATYNGTVVYEDDYSETASTGINLSFTTTTTTANLAYTSTSTGAAATLTYYLKAYT